MRCFKYSVFIGLLLTAGIAQAQQERVIPQTSAYSRQLLTNSSQAQWLNSLLINSNLDAVNLTNLQATNLVGAQNVGYYAIGICEKSFPASVGSGATPIFSTDGIHWQGGSGYPVLWDPTDQVRDPCIIQVSNTWYAAVTSGMQPPYDASDSSSPKSGGYSTIWASTNHGAQWYEYTKVYFTNLAVGDDPYQVWGPCFFHYNGSWWVQSTCFTTHGFSPQWRYCRALDDTLLNWSSPTNSDTNAIARLNWVPNGPILYDASSDPAYNCWIAYYEATSIGIAICNTPLGPWTNVYTATFSASTSTANEGPKVIKLPNGRYRMYVDKYFEGHEAFAESDSLTNNWLYLTNCIMEGYVGHFMPIMLTNLQDIAAAHEAVSSSASSPLWSPFVDSTSLLWASTSDTAYIDFGNRQSISFNSPACRFGYRYGTGFEVYSQNSWNRAFLFDEHGGFWATNLFCTNISVGNPTGTTGPATPGTVNKWMTLTNNGIKYYVPLYQ